MSDQNPAYLPYLDEARAVTDRHCAVLYGIIDDINCAWASVCSVSGRVNGGENSPSMRDARIRLGRAVKRYVAFDVTHCYAIDNDKALSVGLRILSLSDEDASQTDIAITLVGSPGEMYEAAVNRIVEMKWPAGDERRNSEMAIVNGVLAQTNAACMAVLADNAISRAGGRGPSCRVEANVTAKTVRSECGHRTLGYVSVNAASGPITLRRVDKAPDGVVCAMAGYDRDAAFEVFSDSIKCIRFGDQMACRDFSGRMLDYLRGRRTPDHARDQLNALADAHMANLDVEYFHWRDHLTRIAELFSELYAIPFKRDHLMEPAE